MKAIKSQKIRIFLFLFIFYTCPISLCAELVYSKPSVNDLTSLMGVFAKGINKNIDINLFKYNLSKASEATSSSGYRAEDIASSLRENGIFICEFYIDKQDISKIPMPFFADLKNSEWVLVNSINNKINSAGGIEIEFLSNGGKKENLSLAEFNEAWTGHILSLPFAGTLLSLQPVVSVDAYKNKLVFIYSNHKDANIFTNIKSLIGGLVDEAKRSNKKLIYVDELGLIPEESIKSKEKLSGITEKEAFSDVKRQLSDELNNIKYGKAIYDSSMLYRDLYAYLASNKIDTIMEDLDCDLWKRIIEIDKSGMYKKAFNYFVGGDIFECVNWLNKYRSEFAIYNLSKRDEYFSNQLRDLIASNPDSIIFTLRGLGHFGLSDRIKGDECITQVFIVGENNIEDNLVIKDYLSVLKLNNVNISAYDELLMLSRCIPQEMLMTYLYKDNKYITQAKIITRRALENTGVKDIERLSSDIRQAFKESRIISASGLYNFVFNWFKENGFISEEEIKTIPN